MAVVTDTYIFGLISDALTILFDSQLQWFVGVVFVIYVIGLVKKLFHVFS